MKKILLLFTLLFTIGSTIVGKQFFTPHQGTGAPPYGEPESAVPAIDPYDWIQNWVRPEGPAKVALQVGHWKNEELPEELSRLIGNTGASGGGRTEVEVNLKIAEETAALLRAQGVEVEILPATVPPDYWADVFIAIHADGSTSSGTSGYKIAAPWRDFTGSADELVGHLETEYDLATNLVKDPNITRNMRGYYAFAWWRYDHSIHPMTTAAIVETGFITNPSDRRLIATTELPSQALATGITKYLHEQGLLNKEG